MATVLTRMHDGPGTEHGPDKPQATADVPKPRRQAIAGRPADVFPEITRRRLEELGIDVDPSALIAETC